MLPTALTLLLSCTSRGSPHTGKAIGGQTAALASMYLVTALLSEILTNNAAAALMFPIAAQVANDLVIEPKMMSIALMLGASAAFISPFGYQCSLMVYTVGNYKTVDFVRFGTLLQVGAAPARIMRLQ
jgi:di/tricarboxylate transporter